MVDASWTPSDYCDNILGEIRASNLDFLIQESPYSIYITIRKKFIKDAPQISNIFEPQVSSDFLLLQNNLQKKTGELNEARDNIKILEDKVQNCEAEPMKESNKFNEKREEMADEIKLLKNAIKTCNTNTEEAGQKDSLNGLRKSLKSKEKEIYNLKTG